MIKCPQLSVSEIKDDAKYEEELDVISTNFAKEAGVPLKFLNATFQNTCNEITDKVRNFCEKGKGVLVLSGSNGTGKTRTASCAINHRLANHLQGGIFISCKHDMCPLIRSSRSFRAEKSELQVYKELYETPFLVLDEVGRGDDQIIAKAFIENVLSARYDNELPTLITTNFTMKDLCSYVGLDITSRFYETAEVLVLAGEDLRRK